MGTLRVLLALSVVASHTGFAFGVGGRNAVQLFFAISGFLISYILCEVPVYKSTKTFYFNRALRIYPTYFVAATSALIVSLGALAMKGGNSFTETFASAPLGAVIALVVSNLVVLGQDWIMFLGVQNGQLVPTLDFSTSPVLLFQGLLIPQAWSLGLELTFYLIAPFVLRRKTLIYWLIGLSVLLRCILIFLGIGMRDPWIYRFFPTELAFFLLGAIIQQKRWTKLRLLSAELLARKARFVSIVVVFLVVLYPIVPGNEIVKSILLFALILPNLGLLFENQSISKFDKKIGEYSYPIYLWHLLVISVLGTILNALNVPLGSIGGLFVPVAFFSLAMSYLNLKFIDRPVERLRLRIRDGKAHMS